MATERPVLVSGPGRVEHAGRTLIAQPLLTENSGVAGALGVVTTGQPEPGRLGAVAEVARYACGQLELAELDASRARLDRAEVRALRAQISPHFIYNALNTVASFVRTDPDRARELILEFADFTRYSFRAAGEFTVLADELRNIERYLALERARFGDALEVRLQIAPEVLGVVLPFLALQPLVENAVRHGLAGAARGGTVSIVAVDAGIDCIISVEDDGIGMDPDVLRSGALDAIETGTGPAGSGEAAHVGLANVDDRLRAAFGNDYGLTVETAPGAGTKVSLRVPKFRAGIQA
jgi:two-component system, LytTR family, sensor kinase